MYTFPYGDYPAGRGIELRDLLIPHSAALGILAAVLLGFGTVLMSAPLLVLAGLTAAAATGVAMISAACNTLGDGPASI